MKYRDEWKGHLHYSQRNGRDYGQVRWDGRVIGYVRTRGQEGARSPGGMLTNTVFLGMAENLRYPYEGATVHPSLTRALASLIPAPGA